MAISNIQVMEDGPRNYIIKINGTGATTVTTIATPATLDPPCTGLRIKKVLYNLLSTDLATIGWDATAALDALYLNGGNDAKMCFYDIGGLVNNAGAGKTGNVLLTTTGTGSFTIIIEFLKQQTYPFN